MKVSRFTTEIEIDDTKKMLYNTVSRKYHVFPRSKQQNMKKFLLDINKGNYTQSEIELFKELLNKGIIVKDGTDELAKLEFREKKKCFREDIFDLMLYVTNACNFRCTYCTQEHTVKIMETEVLDSVIKFMSNVSRQTKMIRIGWFGGEPLLQYEKILSVQEKLGEICKSNDCKLEAYVVTNGYLLDRDRIKELQGHQIDWMQITIDGNAEIHDKKRSLANGDRTYRRILQNLNEALKLDMKIVLRINLDEESAQMPMSVLEEIPFQYRHLVTVTFCNIFQVREKISLYPFLYQAIRMGYQYGGRNNHYEGCIAGKEKSLIADTDGNILICSNAQGEPPLGKLVNDGIVVYRDRNLCYKIKMTSALDNKECRSCIELPYCIGDCKYGRMRKNSGCLGKQSDGMSLEERARLDYYYDVIKNQA